MRHFPGFVAAAVAVCTLSLVTASQAGTTKAWTAAKGAMPADTSVTIGIDVTAIAKSTTFEKLYPIAVGKNEDVKQGLELVRTACKFDPLVAIKSVAIGLDATQSDGAVYVHIVDLTPAKLASCLKEVAKAKGAGAKADLVTVKTEANITEMQAEEKHIFFGWIGTDVLVMVPKHLDDKAALKNWMGGGLAKGALGKMLGKVKTDAAVFVVSTVGKPIDATHSLKQGYGWLGLASGNLSLEAHADLGDAAAAKSLATDASTQIDQMRKNPPLPSIADLLKNVTVAPAASEIVVKATVVEKDFADLVAMAMAAM